jgi:hypothetical protein
LDIDNIANCQVILYAKPQATSKTGLIIGVVSDVSSGEKISETFEPVDTIIMPAKAEFNKISLSLSHYEGNGKHVAFTTTYDIGGSGAYIDDISIIKRAACAEPDLLNVTESTDTSIILEFTDYAGAKEWEVQYGEAGFSPDENEGVTVKFNATKDTVYGMRPATY